MNDKIYKYVMDKPRMQFMLPRRYTVLHVGLDPISNNPAIWIRIPAEDGPQQPHIFGFTGTGREFPTDAAYCGTVRQGDFMWHVFEIR